MSAKQSLDQMPSTRQHYRDLCQAFNQDKIDRLHNLRTWIQDEQNRLEEAKRRVSELPQRIADLRLELQTLEALQMVPLEQIIEASKQ